MKSLLDHIRTNKPEIDQVKTIEDIQSCLSYHYLRHYICNYSNEEPIQNINVRMENLDFLLVLYSKFNEIATQQLDQLNQPEQAVQPEHAQENKLQQFDPTVYLFIQQLFADVDLFPADSVPSSVLFNAIVLLEFSLLSNPEDFNSQMLLVRLYNMIGSYSTSHSLYLSLNIKWIQKDTLHFIFCGNSLQNGCFSEMKAKVDSAWKFYSTNFKDVGDNLVTSYKHGSFAKIEEILEFNSQLKTSLYYHLTFTDRISLNLIECKE